MPVRAAALIIVMFLPGVWRTAAAQSVFDPSLRVQTYFGGLNQPTGVAFLNGFGDALVTQKNDGRVILFRNRQRVGTALDLPVANNSERGLLSIALSPNFVNDSLVYLYHTAATVDGGEPISNKVSRYKLVGNSLVFDRKIIDIAPGPGPNHDGGKIAFDSKGKLYIAVGDLNRNERTQNFENSSTLTQSGAILRLNSSGTPVTTNPFYSSNAPTALKNIYAYGIRNSFGIALDPVTNYLWDTENGPDSFDEINQLRAGMNSGWQDIMGPRSETPLDVNGLVSLGTQAGYSDPEFSWRKPVAPTDLHFLETSRLGIEYLNDLFVGDVKTGSLFHFDLTSKRRSLALPGPLSDYIADNDADLLDEQQSILFGSGFGVTTDILTGPGGLFVLSLSNGKLYRISQVPPASASVMSFSAMGFSSMSGSTSLIPEPSGMIVAFAAARILTSRARPASCGHRSGARLP